MSQDLRWLGWLLGPLPGLIGELVHKVKEDKYRDAKDATSAVSSGTISADEALGRIAAGGYDTTPEMDSYLQEALANQRTEEARQYETQMANTDLLRSAEQLSALGLSPSNVLSTGGSPTPNVAAASVPAINNANQRFDRNIKMTNALLGVGARLASAGIYGSTLQQVNAASQKMAAAAAHSGQVIRRYDRYGKFLGSTEMTGVSSKHLDDILR